jgi:sulfatase modifying factor 1
MSPRLYVALGLVAPLGLGCPEAPSPGTRQSAVTATAPPPQPEVLAPADVGAPLDASVEADEPEPPDDPMQLHHETTDELLGLFLPAMTTDAGTHPSADVLRFLFGAMPGRFNQGNKAIARHAIGRRACLAGLRDIRLQTDEQRVTCHGHENMVPIYAKGDPATAQACIDIFEFPNQACELPMVWGTPSEAARVCTMEGKRLCTQGEWELACRGDPSGRADWTYAYGSDLDLAICNTNKPHVYGPDGAWICNAHSVQTAWGTCETGTEPSGAFPRCRSRFGVFDLHGNVAEMMTRRGGDAAIYTQLKGSAFFYVDVARKVNEAQKPGQRETYPDNCGYDPRWHVEPLESAVHSNYHLGFRCCLSLGGDRPRSP